mgnify:CR=1 FL=1
MTNENDLLCEFPKSKISYIIASTESMLHGIDI